MSGSVRRLRLRSLLADYFVPLVLAALVVGAAGGYAASTVYGETQTRTETRQVAAWESTGSFTHSAVVVNDTAVYDVGTRLEQRHIYFRHITPRLDGSFAYTYTASDGNLTVEAATTLVLRSVAEGDGGNATEYWRLESALRHRRATLSPGEHLRVPFSLNVSHAARRLQRIDEQFGGTPGQKELYLETRLSLSGTRNGQPVDRTRTYRLPITLNSGVYEVGDSGPAVHSGKRVERVTIPVGAGPLRTYGGPLLVVLAVMTVVGLAGARHAGVLDVSDAERDWLAYQDTRSEFDDWITVARIPTEETPDSPVEVDTLDGLVDIAIDTDRRVLEDSEREAFFVFGEDCSYLYSPPLRSSDTLLSAGDADDARTDADQAGSVNPFTSADSRAADGSDTKDTESEPETDGSE